MKFDILSGFSIEELCEMYGKEKEFFEEAHRKLSPTKKTKVKALKDFPIGKSYRWKGQLGVTSGSGTFMTGEKDYKPEEKEKKNEAYITSEPMNEVQRRVKAMIQEKRRKLGYK